MPQRCSVCIHKNVDAINCELLRGTPLRKIAEQYGVSSTALFRHKQHMPAALAQAKEAEDIAQAEDLLKQIAELRKRAFAILDKAEQAGDLKTALLGIREAKGCIELLAKMQIVILEKQQQEVKELPKIVEVYLEEGDLDVYQT